MHLRTLDIVIRMRYLTINKHYVKHLTSSGRRVAATGPYTKDTYERRPEHVANSGQVEMEKYVLTLHTDARHQNVLNNLRNRYFPRRLNRIPAHVCLFHALPGSQLAKIRADIKAVVQEFTPFLIETKDLRPFANGHGVALSVEAPLAPEVHQTLKNEWGPFLSKQDQNFKPHYTIANQLVEMTCQKAVKEIRESFEGSKGQVDGLTLFRYERGLWKDPQVFLLQS